MEEKHKRYLVFSYNDYYPSGGLSDMRQSFDSIPEAIDFLKKDEYKNKELYDRINGVKIDLTEWINQGKIKTGSHEEDMYKF